MKTQKKLSYALLSLCLILLASCQNETIENIETVKNSKVIILKKDSNNLELKSNSNNYTFNFNSKEDDGKLISELSIFHKEKLILKSQQVVDSKIPVYKLTVYKEIIRNANNLKNQITPETLNHIIPEFEIFARSILFNSKTQFNSTLVQSIFYHNSILNTVKRSYKENKDCECLPHPGYFVDQTPFWCQEDYLVNVTEFAEIIKNSNSEFLPKKKKVLELLENYNETEISIDKISEYLETKKEYLNRIETKFNSVNNPTSDSSLNKEEDCTKGTDLGCCGNYSGCCWYWSYYCLDHDLACLACDKWHCGPSCEPGV